MTTPAQPPARGRGNRNMLRNPVTWVILLGVAVTGGAIILYRRNKANAAANAAAATPTPDQTDLQGQIATLQTEIADLQSSFAQAGASDTGADTSGDTDTGTGERGGVDSPGGLRKLPAPAGFSVTPHAGFADFGWSKVPGARAYELQVSGAGGRGTGASHYDHAGAGNHAEGVRLSNGAYKARVRAGTSTTALTGAWTPEHSFTVGRPAGGKPPSGGGGGEPED